MNLRYISKYEDSKKNKRMKERLNDMKSFTKKEIITLTQKQLELPIFIMKL
ncbi:MAG TPA: hypothetical protein PLS49_05945 [Candidatus Woesebacteria bacterium]|nr:hypothetical protein [Candidatus Woesebacteria bacterium]